MLSEAERARAQTSTAWRPNRGRITGTNPIATAAAHSSAFPAGVLTVATWLPTVASTAPAMVRARATDRERVRSRLSRFAVCDHMLCCRHTHSATLAASAVMTDKSATHAHDLLVVTLTATI